MSAVLDGLKNLTKGTIGLGKGAVNLFEGAFGIGREGLHYTGKGLEQVQKITGGGFLEGYCKCVLKNGKQCRNKIKGAEKFCFRHLKRLSKKKRKSRNPVTVEIEHDQDDKERRPVSIEIEHKSDKSPKRRKRSKKIKKLVKKYYEKLKKEEENSNTLSGLQNFKDFTFMR
jgi:hypothetical protein